MNGGETGRDRWSGSPRTSGGRPRQAPNDTQTPVLSPPLMGPQVGLAADVLKYKPSKAGGGAGPAGSGRGLSCTCRSGRSCWTAAPPWPFGPRSTQWAEAPEPAARSTAPPMRRGCAGCTGPGPAGGVRTGGHGKGAPTPPALPTSLRLISPG